ncbi:MAG: DUF502 domain-containing protein [Chitinophagaceae bacterium]|nr:DUF502 domain-containing protein [Chitinophagaceae bacterium]
MENPTNPTPGNWKWKKILQYLLQGLLVTAPIVITGYLIYWFVSSVDSWLPIFRVKDESGHLTNQNYGLGFVIIIVTLIVIGYLSSNFITRRVFSLFDYWLEHAPGIKFIYSSIKDFFEAFAGNKKKFTRPVLVSIFNPEVYQIGFITSTDAHEFGLRDYVTVYIPMSYSFAGHTYIVPLSKTRIIDKVSASNALKYAISGGVAEVDDDKERS